MPAPNPHRHLTTVLAWTVALLMFFPVFWMLLASLKTELQAVSTPPVLLFQPTLENYEAVFQRADYFQHALNSVIVSVASTLLAMAVAIPCAWTMAFYPTPPHPRRPPLDALHQNAPPRRRTRPHLPPLPRQRPT